MRKNKTTRAARRRRHVRLRKSLVGTTQRPRLAVYRSANHIYAQIIDDSAGHTMVAACDLESDLRKSRDGKKKAEVATLVGQTIGRRAQEKGIGAVVFDRGGFMYHGRVKALAEAVRKAGLSF